MKKAFGITIALVNLLFTIITLGMFSVGVIMTIFAWDYHWLELSYLGIMGYILVTVKDRQYRFISSWALIERHKANTLDNLATSVDVMAKSNAARADSDMDIIKKLNGLN